MRIQADQNSWRSAVSCAIVALFAAWKLVELPGLIERHHQGLLMKLFGSWFGYALYGMLAPLMAWRTITYAKQWMRSRTSTRTVEANVS